MEEKSTPVLLVTANVGSIFEDPSHMLKIWTEEFLSTVAKLDPKFIALHCQEVGGKNYERSMKHVEDFVRLFMSSEELRLFDKVRVYLDEDYSSAEHFTALGNFYFIHESLSNVLIWDFAAMTFVPVQGKEVHSGNIEAVTSKEKSKFPQDFFPECKWSRKGFLRTRWSMNGTVFDLINIHLFHDASNFIAMESFPSMYSKNRQRALEHTLERFHNDSFGRAPFFIFGDFNFRTDTQGVINKLADGLSPVRVQSNKNHDHTKLQYKDGASQVVLSLGKKEFSHADHQSVFLDENGMWLKEFDKEMEAFTGRLFEFPITFPPSYPFEEEEKGGNNYMKTRCPAWCDRVIMSNTAKNLVSNVSNPNCVEYGLMGPQTRMGDHKPVYLKMDLINNAGIVSCCTLCDTSSNDKNVLCFGRVTVCEPASWSCSSLSLKQSDSAPSSALTLRLDTSAAALVADRFLAPPHSSLLHEPYTPESMETPSSSPIPIRIQRDFEEITNVEWKCGADDDDDDDDGEEKLPVTKLLCNEISQCLTRKSRQSDSQHVSSFENLRTVHNFDGSDDSNSKYLAEIVNDKISQENASYMGVPHVLICYSDSLDTELIDSCISKQVMKVNENEIKSSVSQVEGSERQLQTKMKASCGNLSDAFNPGRNTMLHTNSVFGNEMSENNTSCDDNVISSLKPFSSDSGILQTASCTSSRPSSSSHSTKNESLDVTTEESADSAEFLIENPSHGIKGKEILLHLYPEEIELNSQNLKTSFECVSFSNHVNFLSYKTRSNYGNESMCSVEDRNQTISCDKLINNVSYLPNDSADINEIRSTNTEPTLVSLHFDSDLKMKNCKNTDSQDCINVMNTEDSSQLKGDKRHKKAKRKTKLKRNSERDTSSCCCIT